MEKKVHSHSGQLSIYINTKRSTSIKARRGIEWSHACQPFVPIRSLPDASRIETNLLTQSLTGTSRLLQLLLGSFELFLPEFVPRNMQKCHACFLQSWVLQQSVFFQRLLHHCLMFLLSCNHVRLVPTQTGASSSFKSNPSVKQHVRDRSPRIRGTAFRSPKPAPSTGSSLSFHKGLE